MSNYGKAGCIIRCFCRLRSQPRPPISSSIYLAPTWARQKQSSLDGSIMPRRAAIRRVSRKICMIDGPEWLARLSALRACLRIDWPLVSCCRYKLSLCDRHRNDRLVGELPYIVYSKFKFYSPSPVALSHTHTYLGGSIIVSRVVVNFLRVFRF